MTNIKIIGSGSYIPSKTITNRDLETLTGVSSDKIKELTGIETRFYAEPNDTQTSMAKTAVLRLLKDIRVIPNIDALVYLQNVPPQDSLYLVGGNLHEELKKERILNEKNPFYSIIGGCADWIDALIIAHSLIKSGMHKTVLCVTSTDISRSLDFNDYSTAILFGDGACANLLSITNEEGGFLKFYSKVDGSGCRAITVKYPNPQRRNTTISMPDGSKIFNFAVRSICEAVKELTQEVCINDVNYFIFHQANGRILDRARKNLGIPKEKEIRTLLRFGNTNEASIGITFDELIKERIQTYKSPQKGDLAIIVGFGAGLKVSGVLYQL